jgi:hypothetical protein
MSKDTEKPGPAPLAEPTVLPMTRNTTLRMYVPGAPYAVTVIEPL